ncbi:tripartite tricarboxylate transporter permease [Alkalicoccobacillus porphyridii]|uniref:Tripartite tricarboxylate transporter permease n=1 Tax=Alkalicoccobacillus porphyridii TaxID=2597270 RepID=A0A554A3Y6_9BACI|nr:tripartite tricarboxylate transporter permease [Alkalicoccobacillus porphyridii]TSB48402.1 tripartite tricarboxylate transporter permease [Alkalicoccobacillus porphyridii]
MDIQTVFGIFLEIVTSSAILYILAGTVLGVIFGALPGLTATLAIVILLPFTYGMDPSSGIAMLIAAYIGGISGGVVASVLIGMPGTPSSITTVYDGYPMAKQGLGGKALAIGATGSLIGSLVSLFFLVTLAPQLAAVALRFSPIEYTMVILFAFITVAGLTGNFLKSLLVSIVGLGIALIGFDPLNSTERNPFGLEIFAGGITPIPAMIGLFVVSKVFIELEGGTQNTIIPKISLKNIYPKFKELRASWTNYLRSSLIGTAIGILPGIGGTLANFVSYDQAKKASKEPETFGKGNVDGLIASETANNAVIAGNLIPLLALGIPGDSVSAILLGGLQIQGLQPGPLLFQNQPEFIVNLFISFFLAVIAMYVFMMTIGMRVFPKMLAFKKMYLLPFVLVMSIAGAYNIGYRVEDIWIMVIFGIIGYLFHKLDFPTLPIVITLLLGATFEMNLRTSLILTEGSLVPFFTRPISLIFVVLTLITIAFIIRSTLKEKRLQNKAS